MDSTLIGQITAELMDALEEDYGEEAEILEAMVVVLVNDGDSSVAQWRASEEIWSHKYGLVMMVQKSLERLGPGE